MQDARPDRRPRDTTAGRGTGRVLEPWPSAAALRRLLLGLAAVVAAIGAINLSPLMNSWTVGRLFDMNGELTFTAWLSSAMLLAIGGTAVLLAVYGAGLGQARGRVAGWWAMAALFAALSADESAMLHELVGLLTSERVVEIPALPGVFAWVAVLTPLALAVAVGVYRWLRDTVGWRQPHGRMGLAALGMWLTVPLLEVLDPALGSPLWAQVLEEGAEFAGEILMLGCLLGHFRELQIRHPLTLTTATEPGADGLDFSHAPSPSPQGRDRGARSSAPGAGVGPRRDPGGDLARDRDRAPKLAS